MITLLMFIGLTFATPRMSEREIHLKYFKQVYGENFENLKDLKFWYGLHSYAPAIKLPTGIVTGSIQYNEFINKKNQSYLPTSDQVEIACKLKVGNSEGSRSYKQCLSFLKRDYRQVDFSPVYDKADSKEKVVGIFNRKRGEMYYRGEYLNLRPYKKQVDEEEGHWDLFLAPVLDYKITIESGLEREWMRLPTMGHPGEAWVGTTDVEGPLPILDLKRADIINGINKIKGLGLAQLSKTRLLKNSCYVGVDSGHVLFKQFIFRMNWDKSLIKNHGGHDFSFINKENLKIDIAEGLRNNPKSLSYFANLQKFPPLVFRIPFIDFFLGLGDQFPDASQVALTPNEPDRNCDYPAELFYKQIPKSYLTDFAVQYSGLASSLYSYESLTRNSDLKVNETQQNSLGKALRGEEMKEPFSVFIHQIYKME